MTESALTNSFLVDTILVSHEDQQYELMSGIDEEGPFIELWVCRGREPEDREAKMLYSYWLNNRGVFTFQKHHSETSPGLEAIFVDEAEKLLPVLNEKISQLPIPVRWLYQTTD